VEPSSGPRRRARRFCRQAPSARRTSCNCRGSATPSIWGASACRHELRGVGKNMQDHYVARVSCPVVGAQTANERSRGLPLAAEVMRWLFTGKGMLTYGPSIVTASVKILEESATPLLPRAASIEGVSILN